MSKSQKVTDLTIRIFGGLLYSDGTQTLMIGGPPF